MICVECGQAVEHVYREFSKGNIRLTVCVRSMSTATQAKRLRVGQPLAVVDSRLSILLACEQPSCGSFADLYVEYDLILVVLDLLLLKVQVFRHCLFNLNEGGLKVSDNRKWQLKLQCVTQR